MVTLTDGTASGYLVLDEDDLAAAAVEPRRQYPIPEWCVPHQHMFTEVEDLPGWRSVDLRPYPVGTMLLDRHGVVQRVEREDGYLQRQWKPVGSILPRGWHWTPLDGWESHVTAMTDAGGKALLARASHMAALASYWMDETVPLTARTEDMREFWDELTIQLHRPAPIRKAVVKITKAQTRRGKVSLSNADPMTPWALRLATERLVADLAADTDHQADDVNLKRWVNLSARAEELQALLDEVSGHLTAGRALLGQEER